LTGGSFYDTISFENEKGVCMALPDIDEINDLCREIAEETLTADIELQLEALEEESLLELEKQYEFMSYADQQADLDAEFYGLK
jgi:hypothetical protein